MVGDSNAVFREGKWWLYFKGKKAHEKPWETHIGVAVSDHIEGPYEVHPNSPLFDGHAFTAWKHRGGIAALRGKYWPEILWSEDGLDFVDTGGRLKTILLACSVRKILKRETIFAVSSGALT